MDVLVSGVNSYIGRRAASNLNTDDFKVYGLVRDDRLFKAMGFEPITAELHTLDLLKKDERYNSFTLPNIDMGIFFTQSPDLGDHVSLQVELARLKNFVELLQRNFCNRILLIGRLMDKEYIAFIQQLFEKYDIIYTIVLKNIALGKGSLADRYFRKILTEKYVLYDEALARVEFKPIAALDVLRWIRTIDWANSFKNEVIELGGITQMSVRELFRLYKKVNGVDNVGFSVPHFLYNLLFKNSKKLHKDDVMEIKRMFRYEYPVDNTAWAKRVSFSFTPIEEVIINDV